MLSLLSLPSGDPLRFCRLPEVLLQAVELMVSLSLAGTATSRELTSRTGIAQRRVESLLAQLRRAGLVTSQMGRTGGYTPSRSPDEVVLREVAAAVATDLVMSLPSSWDLRQAEAAQRLTLAFDAAVAQWLGQQRLSQLMRP